jgi:enolase
MSGARIAAVRARQILDSRGRPTVEADVELDDGSSGRASVPSGASTGSAEAHELRDADAAVYAGLGVSRAVAHVNGEIAQALRGLDAAAQRDIDTRLTELDGTPQLSRLGANAVLATSLAVARAAAASQLRPLYAHIAELAGVTQPLMPLPMVNILSGGLHASRGMDAQDFLAIPARAASIADAVHTMARVRAAASDEARDRGLPTLLADEGGLAPGFERSRDALQMMLRSIERAGLKPGDDVLIAVDVAATTLRRPDGNYGLRREGRQLAADELIDMFAGWARNFPVVSIEDGLAEDDWPAWRRLTERLGDTVQLVGDDLFATQPRRVKRGIDERAANGVLVKANQNGTLSGAIDVVLQARAAGFATIVSARSGETEDAFMSDLAVGTAAGQIKIGSLRTSSTVAKYNQLLRIEEASGAPYAGVAALAGRRPA